MSKHYFKRKLSNTGFVLLDTRKCEACWKCMNVCARGVIGRINLPWHKHIRFVDAGACTGCMACVKSCNIGALYKHINKRGC